ncbi:hypothetical protein [Pseudonocardia sp.]|uniref:hypothetical protein n=1 Tax=Pseudonocardia sp. TaxID=60912 RepID=UPI002629F716|nr:hypothetical protein [Pseudonocardia sp.]
MQALSARVFGGHTWSLIFPQVVAGALTVLFLFRAGSRHPGVRRVVRRISRRVSSRRRPRRRRTDR